MLDQFFSQFFLAKLTMMYGVGLERFFLNGFLLERFFLLMFFFNWIFFLIGSGFSFLSNQP